MHVPRRQVQEEEELPPEEGGHGCRKGMDIEHQPHVGHGLGAPCVLLFQLILTRTV